MTEFSAALKQVATERGIPVESVLESIQAALVAAYRRDYGGDIENITVELDRETGSAKILMDGKDITPDGFGRIAAQTAKQVILQKIRETEKEVILDEYKGKIGTISSGHIFRNENNIIIMDLGKAQAILPQSEQIGTEEYRLNQRLKVLVKDVREGLRGAEIIVSRSDPEFVKKLFEQEVPEIASKVVVIEAMAREAGSRTKMAVSSKEEKVDPVGSCVGQKGVRVQSIIAELGGEKIDIVPYSPNIEKFIASSLSPAKVMEVNVDIDNKEAKVSVPEDQLSLAIGKDGQNVRLAAKLTKWRIDIKGAAGLFGVLGDEKKEDENEVRGVWDSQIQKPVEKVAEESLQSDTPQDDSTGDDDKKS
ncbi:transcription termination factor NusA [candidate division WWE3 bacterium RIFCSPLOWO2_12_FULL_36_10]|uniref:Transcription termination/antitermination protein NusA n=1 Tax=candidate division WWE3 bacterium RIFCSPLOWO2_12_FULL_36_10 TaxID=1802630 RepID=A0A1F4VK35_UNCKA|nr:MAG: transcription termination factor NusA [candidate division WWE3 bacterium RIFCSPLOWO2_12_FULL_36_10]